MIAPYFIEMDYTRVVIMDQLIIILLLLILNIIVWHRTKK